MSVRYKSYYGETEYSGMYGDYTITPLGNYDMPTGWPMKPYKRPYGGTPRPPVMYEKPSDPEEEGAGYGYSNGMSQQERDVFYYHSYHIGSTSYITDKDGNATQFVCYKPYGEALVDEHATSFESPWKFNGKELDAETGLYYYGARYYEPVLAMWYGVNALTEKSPNIGGYVYCAGNLVKLVDVDGNEPTANEAALMAIHVYRDDNAEEYLKKLNASGWFISNVADGIKLNYTQWYENGLQSEVFERNAAAVSPLSKFRYGLSNDSQITNYVIIGRNGSFFKGGDPLTNIQDAIGLKAPGKRISIPIQSSDWVHTINEFLKHGLPEL